VAELVREVRLRQPRIGTRKLRYLLREPMSEALKMALRGRWWRSRS
jgi:hypothetical protein